MLILNNISFAYADRWLLKNVQFHLNKGETASIFGLSGSGKTTLLKMMAGLLPYDQGTIELSDKPSLMLQEDLLLPWRTMIENVMLPAELGRNPSKQKDKALKLIEEVGLQGYEDYFPAQLSGGMRQRAALARALLLDNKILLLDEPFASLDMATREHMYKLIKSMQQRRELTICIVTHDFRDALALSDRILLLKDGKLDQEWLVSSEDRQACMSPLQETVKKCLIG